MDNGKREFDELRDILQKLDRSLDEAQHKRQHGSVTPATSTNGVNGSPNGHPQTQATFPPAQPAPTQAPAQPAIIPDHDAGDTDGQSGRLKAKPLRRNRPENTGPAHGWVH
ncbi:MAG: hypothetical protein ACFCBV_06400 [Phycisphaerales bacterium]